MRASASAQIPSESEPGSSAPSTTTTPMNESEAGMSTPGNDSLFDGDIDNEEEEEGIPIDPALLVGLGGQKQMVYEVVHEEAPLRQVSLFVQVASRLIFSYSTNLRT